VASRTARLSAGLQQSLHACLIEHDVIMTDASPPLYIAGRQHCGNTMLATMLGRHEEVFSFTGEGTFFEHYGTDPGEERDTEWIVQQVIRGADIPFGEDVRQQVANCLTQKSSSSSTIGRYTAGKTAGARMNDATRWVQKATSYIFHVDTIFRAIPDARVIFLIRNPFDLAASLKRRGEWRRMMRMIWGWNQGVAVAESWRDDSRFLNVRYEDLVEQPTSVLREICQFADLPFEEALLKIPHVNRSETPYNTESSTTGLDDSRVYYYRDVLSAEEEAVVRAWTDTECLRSAYPNLPEPREHRTARQIGPTARAVGGLVHTLAADHAATLMQNPGHVLDRIRRRI